MFYDMKMLSIKELVGYLRAAEDRFEPSMEQVTEKVGRLLLTKEDWAARNKSHMLLDSSSSSGGKGGGQSGMKEKSEVCDDARDSGVKLTSTNSPRRKGNCHKCGIYGHWAKECKKAPKEERQEAVHHVNADTEQLTLMVAQVCNLVLWTTNTTVQHVFPNQEHVFSVDYHEVAWVLDTGAANHMTGCQVLLETLDETVCGTVCFGDGSMVEIGAMTIADKN